MVSLSIENKELVARTLTQILEAIAQLKEWNEGITDESEWTRSSFGMQKLAANCMLISAIGEGVRQIEKRAGEEFLALRSDIPWHEIIAMRNHIAHGYFDIDADFVLSVIQNDLDPLEDGIRELHRSL